MSDTSAKRPKVRAYYLTPEQLWVAYQEHLVVYRDHPVYSFFATLADTRLEMVRLEQAKEREQPIEEAAP